MFKYYIGSLVAVLIASLVAFATGHAGAAFLISTPGLLLVMLGWVVWAAIWDSRSVWPNSSFLVRLGNIMTYQRRAR